jgi:hypothetical protein
MIALAFVHVIADGFEKMDGLCGSFPIASVFVMGGIMIMFITERASLDYLSSREDGDGSCCHSEMHRHSHGCVRHAHRNWNCSSDLHEECSTRVPRPSLAASDTGRMIDSLEQGLLDEAQSPAAAPDLEAVLAHDRHAHVHSHEHSHAHTHAHAHTRGAARAEPFSRKSQQSETGGGAATEAPEAAGACGGSAEGEGEEAGREAGVAQEAAYRHNRGAMMLGMLEVGIIVHSVVIGMDLGASQDGPSTTLGLGLALSFHQLFEGL